MFQHRVADELTKSGLTKSGNLLCVAFNDFSAFLTMLSSVRALLSEHAASLAEQAAFVGGKSMSENDAKKTNTNTQTTKTMTEKKTDEYYYYYCYYYYQCCL